MNYKKSIIGSSLAFVLATSCCWLPALLVGMGGGTALMGISYGLEGFSGVFVAFGVGLLGLGFYQYKVQKKEFPQRVILLSTITCPKCAFRKEERMPTNACQYFYQCENCEQLLKPVNGDCCVYCSYGTVPCPPIQLDQECC